uniref:PH domain-containing protein n=1 Tax=Parastrongyloides trichosuri TaxID=131310 RepID=A0A0N4ZQG3_PARTI
MSSPSSTISSNDLTSPFQSISTSSSSPSSIINIDKIYQRLNLLEYENQKLMESHGMLVNESNRRSEIQIMEMARLRKKINETEAINEELKALCTMFEKETKKSRQIIKEKDKINIYSSNLIKNELEILKEKIKNLSYINEQLMIENDELKKLCLYLDNQRFDVINYYESLSSIINKENQNNDIVNGKENNRRMDKDNRIEMLTKEMQTSVCLMKEQEEDEKNDNNIDEGITNSNDSICNSDNIKNNDLFEYIHSLENRINHLEMGPNKVLTNVSSEFDSVDEENDLIRVSPLLMEKKYQRNGICQIKILSEVPVDEGANYDNNIMNSSIENEQHYDSIVYNNICKNDSDSLTNNFMRFLNKIEENDEGSDLTKNIDSSFTFDIPPPMADISESIGRLSFCSTSNNSLNSIINSPNHIQLSQNKFHHQPYHPSVEYHYENLSLSSPVYTPIIGKMNKNNENIGNETFNKAHTSLRFRQPNTSNRRSVSMNIDYRKPITENYCEKNCIPPVRLRTGHLQNNSSPIYMKSNDEDKQLLQRACQLQFQKKFNNKIRKDTTKILFDQKSGNIKAELTAI